VIVPFHRVVLHGCCALVLAGAVFSSAAAHAEGFQPPNAEELRMTSEPLAPGAPAVILYRQVDRDDNGLTPHEDNYIRIKILTEEGRKYGDVEIPFFKESEDIIHIHARTIHSDGSIVEFDGKTFDKSLQATRGARYMAKTFTLPAVQVGSIIEYFFTDDLHEDNSRNVLVYGSTWLLSSNLFTKNARFSLKPYSHSGSFMHLRWVWRDLPPGASPKQGSDSVVRMDASNIPAFQEEDFMPPANELKARVDFIYSDDLPVKDATEYWKNFDKKQNGRLENFVGKRKAMEDAVAQIVAPGDPPEVKLRKIYDRVQQIRNKSYELRKTEQESKRQNEKPIENVEELWKRGYGDGSQLTWLYLALVRAAGMEAYGCLVSDRANHFFSPVTMESGKLDANVVLSSLTAKTFTSTPARNSLPSACSSGWKPEWLVYVWIRTAEPGFAPRSRKPPSPGSSARRICGLPKPAIWKAR